MDTDDLLDILEDAIAVDAVQSRAEARRCLQLLLNRPLISFAYGRHFSFQSCRHPVALGRVEL